MKPIGITTTVPSEILLAAGYQPVDLNNILVNDRKPERLVGIAEKDGFPLNCCAWIKGIYGVCRKTGMEEVLCVTGGDCSNTLMLAEVFRLKGVRVIPFSYPEEPDPGAVLISLHKLAALLGTSLTEAELQRQVLEPGRALVRQLDELTWREGKANGAENHLWLVSASDFNQNHDQYCRDLGEVISACEAREPYPDRWLRLAYVGVPPVYARDFYEFIESNEARVVFNEIQRQFSMPEPGQDLAEQYTHYTYPYSTDYRLQDIRREIRRRRVDGVIHYVQAFCHRGIGDIILRAGLELPVLTLEGNDEFFLNSHIKTRIEAFLDMLRRRQQT